MKMKKHNGYTLIEVLIALFIFSIASYLVSVALIENQKNSKILKVKTQRFIEVQRALTLLTQDVSQSTIYLEEDNNQTLGTFKATERELNLTRRGHINPNYISMDSSLRKIKILYEQETLYRGMSAIDIKPEAILNIEDIAAYNAQEGLSLSDEEVVYLDGKINQRRGARLCDKL